MSSITKELNKIKAEQQKQVEESDVIKDVKLLMASDAAEDMRIISAIGKSSNLSRAQEAHGKQLELEKLEGEYAGDVFTIKQIEKLAIDYKLRFLRSELYTGDIDIEVVSKIKTFSKETNTPISEANLKYNFYILAPEESFKLQDKIYFSKRLRDPAIFYKIDETHYRLIHKWGADFTPARLIQGLKWRNIWTYFGVRTMENIFFFSCLTAILSAIFQVSFLNGVGIFFICAFSILLSAIFQCGRYRDDGEAIDGFFSETNWNSDSKIRRR